MKIITHVEIEVEIEVDYDPPQTAILAPNDEAQPGYPASAEFVSATVLVDGKPTDLDTAIKREMSSEWLLKLIDDSRPGEDEDQPRRYNRLTEDGL